MDEPAASPPPRKRPSLIPIGIMAILIAGALFMLWRSSYQRRLSDADLERSLSPAASDFDTGHAAEEMTKRMKARDAASKRFYPMLIALSQDPNSEKRRLAAWAMGHDPAEPSFQAPLSKLITDPVRIVTYNAAPALALRGSDAGRSVLLAMLRPSPIPAGVAGTFRPKSKVGEKMNPGSVIGVVASGDEQTEVLPHLSGRILSILPDGSSVSPETVVTTLSAAESQALHALVALTLPGIGRPEDAAAIEEFLKATPDAEQQVKDQAQQALLAIKKK